MAPKKEKESISVHYDEAEGKRTLVVSGAYGGANHDGSLVVAHLYTEWLMVPTIQQIPVVKGVGDIRKATDIKRGDLQREVQATIALTPENAIVLGKWLVKNGERGIKQRSPQDRSSSD